MTTITEQLSPPPRGGDEARAANILVRAGAQFVDEALVSTQTTTITWSDDHPLNKAQTWRQAFRDLFR